MLSHDVCGSSLCNARNAQVPGPPSANSASTSTRSSGFGPSVRRPSAASVSCSRCAVKWESSSASGVTSARQPCGSLHHASSPPCASSSTGAAQYQRGSALPSAGLEGKAATSVSQMSRAASSTVSSGSGPLFPAQAIVSGSIAVARTGEGISHAMTGIPVRRSSALAFANRNSGLIF